MNPISFKEWGESFQLDPKERARQVRFAADLLNSPQFRLLLAEMEFNILQQWRITPWSDEDRQRELRLQQFALQKLKQALSAYASDEMLDKKSKTG